MEMLHLVYKRRIKKMSETKTVYEVMLRYQAHDELIVDVRKDIERLDGEPITEEYVEGFSYDRGSCNLETTIEMR